MDRKAEIGEQIVLDHEKKRAGGSDLTSGLVWKIDGRLKEWLRKQM